MRSRRRGKLSVGCASIQRFVMLNLYFTFVDYHLVLREIYTNVRQTFLDPLRGKSAFVVVLFYNTLSATRNFLRRYSVVEEVTINDSIPRRGLTKYNRLRVMQFFYQTVVKDL
jgi:hypothetical protein